MAEVSEREPLLGSHKSFSGTSHNSYQAENTRSQNAVSGSEYHDNVSMFSSMSDVIIPVSLSWQNVNVFVKDKKKRQMRAAEVPSGNQNGRKQIITNVSGVVKPGTLVAIMGASGAGKSTLMNVLTNRNLRDYEVQGEIQVNGIAVGNAIRNISAYVQQDDLFITTLTVRETLIFRALLRMDKSIKKKVRLERVEEVIQEMGLTKCADTQIGMSEIKKGISGGEKKRLSFACEMLTNPPLLFCDEPTSGLDSFMAQNIVQTLQGMAEKKRTILCTIHQPSSEIFAMFDQVLLLAEGRVAFMGSSKQAVEFFRGLNYTCPTNFNPADFYIMTLAIVPGREDECRQKVHAVCDAFSETPEAQQIRTDIQNLSSRARRDELITSALGNASRYEASWLRQFFCILWRSWLSLIRNTILFRVRVVQTVFVAIILGLIYLRLNLDQRGVMNINGALFLLITNTSFTSLFAVVNSFPNELPIFLREYGTGLYRTDVYYLAKNLAELPTFIILPVILISVDYWMMGLYEDLDAFLIAAGVIVLISNVAVSFGYVISSLAGEVNIALAVAPPLLIPFMMFGGFFLNNDSVPVYFIWLKYLSWFKYGNELLAVNQWENVDEIECDTIATNSTSSTTTPSGAPDRCLYRSGSDVLDYLSFSADNDWLNLGLLFALMAAFRTLSFIFLLVRARLSKS